MASSAELFSRGAAMPDSSPAGALQSPGADFRFSPDSETKLLEPKNRFESLRSQVATSLSSATSRLIGLADQLFDSGQESNSSDETQIRDSFQEVRQVRSKLDGGLEQTGSKLRSSVDQAYARFTQPIMARAQSIHAKELAAERNHEKIQALHTIYTMLTKYEAAQDTLTAQDYGDPLFAEDMKNRLATSIKDMQNRRFEILSELGEDK